MVHCPGRDKEALAGEGQFGRDSRLRDGGQTGDHGKGRTCPYKEGMFMCAVVIHVLVYGGKCCSVCTLELAMFA